MNVCEICGDGPIPKNMNICQKDKCAQMWAIKWDETRGQRE